MLEFRENLPIDFKHDYYVLIFPVVNQETKVEVFYEKDIKHISLKELEQTIIKNLI